ncbi:hypothetical protein Vadar_016327 [Vaccinium darrowii]|uniref:Uncharacterized protein n=1 Tax=Vaccinium darrowii TaxID=229202 RepID=A0ACB7YE02_9ERIC|nr:hypothetical protein Vadar_016327 [Vaccinium darrowii]
MSKRPAHSRSTMALAASLSSFESKNNSENSNLISSTPILLRMPKQCSLRWLIASWKHFRSFLRLNWTCLMNLACSILFRQAMMWSQAFSGSGFQTPSGLVYTSAIVFPSLLLFMMAATTITITAEEYKLFYSIDRRLYTQLTKDLNRDPVECIRIMALWLWLERHFCFAKIVKRILSLPHILINELADEAVTCLNCLAPNPFLTLSDSNDIPLTQNVLNNEISLQFFLENRIKAIEGVANMISDVCVVFSDIMHEALERNSAQNLADTQMLMSSLVQPGFDRLRIGDFEIRPKPAYQAPVVHPDDRTMFVTFSKGYPVWEWEIREFFTQLFGDCIESLHMQDVQPGEQSLFSKIVFYSPGAIDMILSGQPKVKFTINGKHIWMRKFVPKTRSPGMAPPPLLPRPAAPGPSNPWSF